MNIAFKEFYSIVLPLSLYFIAPNGEAEEKYATKEPRSFGESLRKHEVLGRPGRRKSARASTDRLILLEKRTKLMLYS